MQVFYQGVALGVPNAARFTWTRTPFYDASDRIIGVDGEANFAEIAFPVFGATIPLAQADCAAKMAVIETALQIPYGDLIVYNDDLTASVNTIMNAATYGGVRPSGLTWSDKPGAQFVTWREFSCRFRWQQVFAITGVRITEFRESVTIQGGNPKMVVREPINFSTSAADEVITVPRQKFTVQQSGSATGYNGYPNLAVVAPLVFTGVAPNNTNPVTYSSPDRVGNLYRNYRVTWNYTWEFGDLPSIPVPNFWV